MPDFHSDHRGLAILAILVSAFTAAAILEALFPRRAEQPGMAHRWINNIALAVLTISIVNWLEIALNVSVAWWVSGQDLGLLQHWETGWLASLLITFVVLELSVYAFHRLMHRVPWLWRLHAVHHSDTEFDITLAYRNHPLAAAFLLCMRLPVIVLLGAPAEIILMYEATRVVQDLLSHSNIRIPPHVEKRLRLLIVTPDFHRLHHSSTRRYTDSNFSSTFPWFDYLFRTASQRPFRDHETMQLGLERFRQREDSRLDNLLLMPFDPNRFRRSPDRRSSAS